MFYGQLEYHKRAWRLKLDPHVLILARKIFPTIPQQAREWVALSDNIEVRKDLRWFMIRYPLKVASEVQRELENSVASALEQEEILEGLVSGETESSFDFGMQVEPRFYQKIAAEIAWAKRGLLNADELGLGKTVSAISMLMNPACLPACLILPQALQAQWERELRKFAPHLWCHKVTSGTPYSLPTRSRSGPDVIMMTYRKASGWADVAARYCSSVIYDEVHELRIRTSDKWKKCKLITDSVSFHMGLSATPVWNMGSEIFNVVECCAPGALGTWDEFVQRWCTRSTVGADKLKVRNPEALSSFLKRNHIMVRRTLGDVGIDKSGPRVFRQAVDCDLQHIRNVESRARELARKVRSADKSVSQISVRNLGVLLREATGKAKAVYVAGFVTNLVEQGVPVILTGWHHSVYEIWREELEHLRPAFFTGAQSESQKMSELARFSRSETDVFVVSNRGAAGLDGLEKRSTTLVVGEPDWSPGVIEQLGGRVHRGDKIGTIYLMMSDHGTDPIMEDVLGIKEEQVRGIRDGHAPLPGISQVNVGEKIRELANNYF